MIERAQMPSERGMAEGLINKSYIKRRRILEQNLRTELSKTSLASEVLKNRSLFLRRREKKCFYGCHFIEMLSASLCFLPESCIETIANLLFKHNYIVPVSGFVREMSNSTVYYRYPDDSLSIRESLKYEICESRQYARNIMGQTPNACLTGSDIFFLLEQNIMNWSNDTTLPLLPTKETARKIRGICQKMLIHGNIVPFEVEEPERHQKFSPRFKYYLCDSDQRMQLIHEFQRNSTADLDYVKTAKRTRYFTASDKCFGENRKCEDKALYWTLDCEELEFTSERIIAAPDVAVIKESSILLPMYIPPTTTRSTEKLPFIIRKVVRKMASSKYYKIHDQKTPAKSISSIDAEWSVY